jgi:hypothetical protein
MAISHQSIVHKPLDYTQPVDLNLLGKVLQFKQGQYDAGTKQVQSHLDTIASMDVVKDSDRQYLNAKLNNLVGTVNSIGGADFSDPNITNQIAGLSSQIYGDDHVISAVANTKKFRYVQNYYKEMKEKKPKDWNPANEWFDMQRFSGWLSDGQVGTSPDAGAGQVTPFTDYEKDWQALFGKMTANMQTEITDKGLMYRVDTHKYVTPEQIWDAAAKLLTPNQRQQLGIEGRYTYQGLPIHELTKAYDAETYRKVGDAKTQLEDYQAKKKGAGSIADQEKYDKLIAEKTAEINGLLAPIRKNAEQIKEKLYTNEKMSGLASRYAFKQSTSKLQAATDKMFVAKHNLDAAKFQYQQKQDALKNQIEIVKEGLTWSTDPFGNTTLIPDLTHPKWQKKDGDGTGTGGTYNFGNAGLPGLDNSSEEQKVEFDSKSLNERKGTLVKANEQLFKEFVQDYGRKMGLSDVIITDLSDDGHLQGTVSPEMEKAAKSMMESWNAMTKGETINYETLDPLFKNFAGKYQVNQKEIEAVDKYFQNIDNQIMQKYGVTAENYDKYLKYKKAVSDYQTASSSSAHAGAGSNAMFERGKTDALKRLNQVVSEISGGKASGGVLGIVAGDLGFDISKMKEYEKNATTERNALIASSNIRINLPTKTQGDDKNKNVAKMIAGNAGTFQWYNEAGEAEGKETLNFDNIEPMSKGYAYLKTDNGMEKKPVVTFKYKTGTDADDFEIRKVPLNDVQAKTLGFGTEVKELTGYEFALHTNGEVNNINTTSGKKYDLRYDVVKYNVRDQNDQTVFVRVKKGDNTISLYNLPFGSYEQAVKFMESQTIYKDSDTAFSQLEAISKK